MITPSASVGAESDAADLAAESSFWAGLLGGTVEAEDDWHSVYVDGAPRLGIQLAPNHHPPEWPDGTPQQIHLDLYVDDVKAAHDEAMSLGARLLKPADNIESTEGYQVYADPAGHPFCLCWGSRFPSQWSEGQVVVGLAGHGRDRAPGSGAVTQLALDVVAPGVLFSTGVGKQWQEADEADGDTERAVEDPADGRSHTRQIGISDTEVLVKCCHPQGCPFRAVRGDLSLMSGRPRPAAHRPPNTSRRSFSIATSGLGPASATAKLNATGSLSIRTTLTAPGKDSFDRPPATSHLLLRSCDQIPTTRPYSKE